MDFTAKTVIVTGAARGLGFSYARELARLGARVVISDIGTDALGEGADPGWFRRPRWRFRARVCRWSVTQPICRVKRVAEH